MVFSNNLLLGAVSAAAGGAIFVGDGAGSPPHDLVLIAPQSLVS